MSKANLRRLRDATEKLSKWSRNGKVFGYFGELDALKGKNQGDRIYEFFCFLRVAKDLKQNYHLRLSNTVNAKKVFPMSPAYKPDYCYYSVIDKASQNEVYQLCYGTKVALTYAPKTTHALDISIQKANASLTPNECDVVMIMDAKFSAKPNSKISKQNISYFGQWVNDLGVQSAATSRVRFTDLASMKGNCLISNALVQDDHDDYCRHLCVKQVGEFDCGNDSFTVIG